MPALEFSVLLLEQIPFYFHLSIDRFLPLSDYFFLLFTQISYLVKETMVLRRLYFMEICFAHVERP